MTTVLPAPIDDVWDRVQRSDTLMGVSRGVVTVRPVDPPQLPERWKPGRYKVSLRALGLFSLGEQTIGIEMPEAAAPARALRDNGKGALFPVWDHWILLEPAGAGGTRYTDRLKFDSVVPEVIAMPFVKAFFWYRQRRWHSMLRRKGS